MRLGETADPQAAATSADPPLPNHRAVEDAASGGSFFILEATREVPRLVQSSRKTVGVRIPDHPVTFAIIGELGRPVISTTAARHGQEPHVDPKELDIEFPGLGLVVDAGPGGTVPTTVVDLTGRQPRVVRAGAGDAAPFGA